MNLFVMKTPRLLLCSVLVQEVILFLHHHDTRHNVDYLLLCAVTHRLFTTFNVNHNILLIFINVCLCISLLITRGRTMLVKQRVKIVRLVEAIGIENKCVVGLITNRRWLALIHWMGYISNDL